MDIKFLPQFREGYKLLTYKDKELVKATLDLFYENPHDPILANHPLRKPMI